jgi:hypothetical protein
MNTKQDSAPDPEIEAINVVYEALRTLELGAQARVIAYVAEKLGIPQNVHLAPEPLDNSVVPGAAAVHPTGGDSHPLDEPLAGSDGISTLAQKWMRRNGITSAQISNIYSVGGDEIELIAESVPGQSKRQRMRNILLLMGIAAYLGSGAARVSHEQLKVTCLHYDAYDANNFAAHLRSFEEMSGTKHSGYTLNQRGLAAARDLIKTITASNG